jgi:zinc D-Ala-D-Ala carboxypeptidase
MTKLTPHFSLDEFVFSEHAIRLGIDNDPPLEIVAALKRTAAGMEKVREFLNNNAIRVSSAYRCRALNDAVHGSQNSQHIKGEAVDFTCPTQGTPRQIVQRLMNSDVRFDQLICEFDSWVHISFSADYPRRQILTIDKQGTRNFV